MSHKSECKDDDKTDSMKQIIEQAEEESVFIPFSDLLADSNALCWLMRDTVAKIHVYKNFSDEKKKCEHCLIDLLVPDDMLLSRVSLSPLDPRAALPESPRDLSQDAKDLESSAEHLLIEHPVVSFKTVPLDVLYCQSSFHQTLSDFLKQVFEEMNSTLISKILTSNVVKTIRPNGDDKSLTHSLLRELVLCNECRANGMVYAMRPSTSALLTRARSSDSQIPVSEPGISDEIDGYEIFLDKQIPTQRHSGESEQHTVIFGAFQDIIVSICPGLMFEIKPSMERQLHICQRYMYTARPLDMKSFSVLTDVCIPTY